MQRYIFFSIHANEKRYLTEFLTKRLSKRWIYHTIRHDKKPIRQDNYFTLTYWLLSTKKLLCKFFVMKLHPHLVFDVKISAKSKKISIPKVSLSIFFNKGRNLVTSQSPSSMKFIKIYSIYFFTASNISYPFKPRLRIVPSGARSIVSEARQP